MCTHHRTWKHAARDQRLSRTQPSVRVSCGFWPVFAGGKATLIKWGASKRGRTKSCNAAEATSQRQRRVEAGSLGSGGGRSPRPLSCSSGSGLPASRAPAPPLPRSLFCPVGGRGNREGAQTNTLVRLPHLPYTFSHLVIRVLTPAPRPSQKTAVE